MGYADIPNISDPNIMAQYMGAPSGAISQQLADYMAANRVASAPQNPGGAYYADPRFDAIRKALPPGVTMDQAVTWINGGGQGPLGNLDPAATAAFSKQVTSNMGISDSRNTGGLYGVLDKTVKPIGEYVTEHPAALFAAPFIAAGALGAFGASLGASGGAVGGEIGAGGSGTFAGGAAAGAANGADPLLGGGLFGAGGAPSTLAGLGGGGASGFGTAAAGAVNAGTAGLTAGIGGAGGAGSIFGGLGGAAGAAPGVAGAVGGVAPAVTPAVMGGAGTMPAAGGALGGLMTGSGGGNAAGTNPAWWQQLLGQLGGKDGNLGSNIFAGLQGAGLLSSLLGGNSISDMLGLTGANAAKYSGPNTAGPGGATTGYNPDTNTLTASGGNLDPLQSMFAAFSGKQLNNTDATAQSANILDLLRKQSQPYEQQAMNGINNSLFSRGRLGAEDSTTGTAYKEFANGLNQADLSRQLAAYQYGQQASAQNFGQATNAADIAAGLQRNAFSPARLNQQTPGQSNPTLDLLYQLLSGTHP